MVVAPRAGLVYSGAVAATAFAAWARRTDPPRRVVIVGPAHRVAFSGVAIHPATKWRMPLSEVQVACGAHTALAQAPGVTVDPRPFAGEHSLEMHLIMLQAMLRVPLEIVPFLVGDAEPDAVAEALRLVWGGPETVIAVSSDLSHFLDQQSAKSIDTDTMRRIETIDAAGLDGQRACGFLPIKATLDIAAERDMRVSGLHLATSADAGADVSRVVGYGAFAFEYAASAQLAESDRKRLLVRCMAARGCIGSVEPRRPLIQDAIADTARAAFADPRFPPLKGSELTGLRLDVSILSYPWLIPARSKSELVGARARPRRFDFDSRQASQSLPAECLATPPRRSRICGQSDGEGRLCA